VTPFWDPQVATWVASMLPRLERGFGECKAMGVLDDDGELVAGMVYHRWSPEAEIIEISGASITSRWLTRPVLWRMFAYPFVDCGCQMVMMRTSVNNQMWNGRGLPRLLKAYGFREYLIPRMWGRHEDGYLFTLTDDDWKANGFHREHR
jgi:hypothetical protein